MQKMIKRVTNKTCLVVKNRFFYIYIYIKEMKRGCRFSSYKSQFFQNHHNLKLENEMLEKQFVRKYMLWTIFKNWYFESVKGELIIFKNIIYSRVGQEK